MADDDNIKRIPIRDLRQEEGAQELAESADMVLYLNFGIARQFADFVPGSGNTERLVLEIGIQTGAPAV